MRPSELPTSVTSLAHVEEMLEHFEHIEQKLEQVQTQLTQNHRLSTLGTIAAMIAHEFNNILTPMSSYCQMSLASPDDHDLSLKAVEKSLDAAERMSRIAESMLGFARGDDDSIADEPGALTAPQCNVRHTIDDALSCIGRPLSKDGIDLTIDVAPDAAVAIAGVHLQQVMVNLILNARQAIHRKSRQGEIIITGKREGRKYLLDVADTGPGIPQHLVDRLFDAFVSDRGHDGRKTQKHHGDNEDAKGTGLGLCICRDLVRAAGGQISVSSQPGRGAMFHLTLPAVQDVETT